MSQWFRSYGLALVHRGLAIGAYPLDEEDVAVLERLGVRRVLNLVQESEYRPGEREAVLGAYGAVGIEEHRLDLVDFGHLPAEQLEAAVQIVAAWLDLPGISYVHCRAGWQRSAAIAAGAIAVHDDLDIDDALALVQERKPTADPLPHQREDLAAWWRARRAAG